MKILVFSLSLIFSITFFPADVLANFQLDSFSKKNNEYLQYARIYFLGSGGRVYEKPHVDKPSLNANRPACSPSYKYTCSAPQTGIGTSCDGKYATPCVCPSGYNKDCSTDPALIGVGSSCDGLYESCRCGYSYNQTCTGMYEGVGAGCNLNPGGPLYQSCKCLSQYRYDVSNCNGDDHPVGEVCEGKYNRCECNPDVFDKPCTNIGEYGVGNVCQGKFKSCGCEAEFEFDGLNCNGDNYPVGEQCSNGKYNKCECNPAVYTETCDGHGQLPVGAECQGKYKSCVCADTFTYNEDNCDLEDHTLEGEACGGRYESCKCIPEEFALACDGVEQTGVGEECEGKFKTCGCKASYTEVCTGAYIGVGLACEGRYESCRCALSFDKTCVSPYVGVGTACDNKYESCACDPVYSQTCSAPYEGVGTVCEGKYESCRCRASFSQECSGNMEGDGEACEGKYESCKCKASFSQECSAPHIGVGDQCGGRYESCCDDSGNKTPCGAGYDETASANGCGNTVYTCAAKACPADTSTTKYSTGYTGVSSCGVGGAVGWSFSTGSYYSGDTVCGVCTVKDGCGSGYSQNITSCSAGYTFKTDGYYGDQACGLCEANNCPGTEKKQSECSGAGWAWTGTLNYVGAEQCGTCTAKTCPASTSTIKYSTSYTSVSSCGSGGTTGWSFSTETYYAGDTACGVCTIKNGCGSGYSQSVTSCTTPQTLSTSGYYGNQRCGLCSCPSAYNKTCTGSNIGVGTACNGKYTSCCANTCSSGYSLTHPGGNVLTQTNACGNTCYKSSCSNRCGYYNADGNVCIQSSCTYFDGYGATNVTYLPDEGITVTSAGLSFHTSATVNGGKLTVNGILGIGEHNCLRNGVAKVAFNVPVVVNGTVYICEGSTITFNRGISGSYTCMSYTTGAAITCPF